MLPAIIWVEVINQYDMNTYFRQAEQFGHRTIIFRVPTSSRGEVYMCVTRTPYLNEKRAVVEVDAQRFLTLWRQNPYGHDAEISQGDPTLWKSDSKFSSAEKGFAQGYDNPVPLAEVSCSIHKHKTPVYSRRWFGLKQLTHYDERAFGYVALTDGITRTIWLLAYGAPYFPVECDIEDAPHLQRFAGLAGECFKTVDQLLPISE